ncbi:GIN domain-containing protein [Mucilaginibacter calamicampi]|uniref:GIN domain-containing protein n=1 Tax=Mucilaginibacter calamicampi TaxID=1302352 RepID=A0ABW2YTN1_9SPHI
MKTQFATIITTVALFVSTTTLTFANTKTEGGNLVSTEIKTAGKIDAVEASGNVEVYLVNGDYDAVNVYSDYYGENAVVKNEQGVLHIASYAADKLVVFVTVSDLQSITAKDKAAVRTYGDALSTKLLDINIKDNATAQLKLDVVAANVTANSKANVQLAGTIENYQLNYSPVASINVENLKWKAARTKEIEQAKPFRVNAMAFGVNAGLLN